MRQRLLVSVAGELTNRLLECFEEDSRGKKHIAVHWFTYAYPKNSFPTSLCGVLVFGSVPGRRLRPPSLSHTALSHTIFVTHTHNFVTHNLCHTHNFVTHNLSHTPLSHTIFHTRQELDHYSDPSGTESHNVQLDKNKWKIQVGVLGLAPCHCIGK